MYARIDFDPASTDESELYGIDFVYDLNRLFPGEQLTSATFSLGVISGTDPAPASHLVGSPSVVVNPASGTSLVTMATQRIAGLVTGVVYWLEAVGVTNAGNTVSLWSRIPVANPPTVAWSR